MRAQTPVQPPTCPIIPANPQGSTDFQWGLNWPFNQRHPVSQLSCQSFLWLNKSIKRFLLRRLHPAQPKRDNGWVTRLPILGNLSVLYQHSLGLWPTRPWREGRVRSQGSCCELCVPTTEARGLSVWGGRE